jgi:hypothetical protein
VRVRTIADVAGIAAAFACVLLVATVHRWFPLLEAAGLRREAQTSNSRSLRAWEERNKHQRYELPVAVKIGETVVIASSFQYCWFPTIHRFRSGEILATVRRGPDARDPESEFSAYTLSKNGGHTWTRLYPLGSGANVDAAYTQTPENDLWVLGGGYDSADSVPTEQRTRFRVPLSKFSYRGLEFNQTRNALLELAHPAATEPAKVIGPTREDSRMLGRDLPLVNPWGEIVDGKNGEWLTTVYYKTGLDPQSTRLVLVRSTDGGMTWNEISIIARVPDDAARWSWMGDEGPNEAGMVRLRDGSLFVVFRTGGYLGCTRSLDDGATWIQPQPMPFQGVAPRLRLLSNGMLALSFGRPGPVLVAFSRDGKGYGWSTPVEIFRGMGTRYTDFVEVAPGNLLLVYDSIPYGWNAIPRADRMAKNTVCGTFIQVIQDKGRLSL